MHRVRRHADLFISAGTDRYGPTSTPLWLSQLDPDTGQYPEDDTRPGGWEQRAYRFIHAPRGCTFYWDQPNVHALHALTRLTGEERYAEAADRAAAWFLDNSAGVGGLLLWGNHYYYDAFTDRHVAFTAELRTHAMDQHPRLHEMRPLVPAWEHLYPLNPGAVEQAIRAAGHWHLFDDELGGFNRHADRRKGCAFLEAGAVLVDALCFLYTQTPDQALLERAQRIAGFSFRHRHPRTGLVINNPTVGRWDGRTATTEVGHWCRTLQHAARRLDRFAASKSENGGNVGAEARTTARQLRTMGSTALAAYLHHGWDERTGRYYGRLQPDGEPDLGQKTTLYQPGEYSSIWTAIFPEHDYPLRTAMAALELMPEGKAFRLAARRWAEICIGDSRRLPAGTVQLAEQYGRVITFLAAYGRQVGRDEYVTAAERIAAEALTKLGQGTLFLGRRNGDRYESVDGVGWLLLGLIYLATDDAQILELF